MIISHSSLNTFIPDILLISYLVCPSGYFGMGCSAFCSGHCIGDEPCDHIGGECSTGCQDGYDGTHCNSCDIFACLSRCFSNLSVLCSIYVCTFYT